MGWLQGLFGGKAIRDQKHRGFDYMDRGRRITDAALSGLDDLDSQYATRLRNGGLTPEVRAGYRVQQGRISDETQRATNAFAAELSQRARATGGRIDPQAAIDSQIEYDAKTNDAAFGARNALAFEEANRSLEQTNAIMEAIERIRATKLGAGMQTDVMGLDLYKDSVANNMRRRMALLGAATSMFGTSASGSAGGR